MRRESSGEGQVAEPGDAEHDLVNAVALELAVPQDLPVLPPRQGVFHPTWSPRSSARARNPISTSCPL